MGNGQRCAQCGVALPKLEGARRAICAICEHCGAEIAYSHALCRHGCGKHLTLARHVAHASRDGLNCPYCRRQRSLQAMV